MVPAAGRGSRLGADSPKVFVPILPEVTIWDAVQERLSPLVEQIVLILSPEGRAYLKENQARFQPASFAKTITGLQPEPLGMGHAIFCAEEQWRDFDDLLIVWGDQFNLSPATLQACLARHQTLPRPALTLPLLRAEKPYVEYVFNDAGELTTVRQSREGDVCQPGGFSDVGVFLVSGGAPLLAAWQRYRAGCDLGTHTKEINFLPFLAYLSSTEKWPVGQVETHDPAEAIGINTPAELAFARELLQNRRHTL